MSVKSQPKPITWKTEHQNISARVQRSTGSQIATYAMSKGTSPSCRPCTRSPCRVVKRDGTRGTKRNGKQPRTLKRQPRERGRPSGYVNVVCGRELSCDYEVFGLTACSRGNGSCFHLSVDIRPCGVYVRVRYGGWRSRAGSSLRVRALRRRVSRHGRIPDRTCMTWHLFVIASAWRVHMLLPPLPCFQ